MRTITIFVGIFIFSLLAIKTSFSQCEPYAGMDLNNCYTSATLDAGELEPGFSGMWTSIPDDAVFSNFNDPNSDVTISYPYGITYISYLFICIMNISKITIFSR